MKSPSNIFQCKFAQLSNNCNLHLINIKRINSKLEQYLDDSIVSICEGNSTTDIDIIKTTLIEFLEPKLGKTLEMGAVAEFFIHLYLKSCGFKQEFLYLNLEEGSAKKGFDGYYSLLDEEWIYESKSGTTSTKKITHCKKINEAFKDLEGKVSKKGKNNPWRNAYNHANQLDVNTDSNIRQNIKKLSNDYVQGKYYDVKSFNIIPSSTIFLEGNWDKLKMSVLKPEIKALVKKFEYKKICIICMNKKSVSLFWDYLNK